MVLVAANLYSLPQYLGLAKCRKAEPLAILCPHLGQAMQYIGYELLRIYLPRTQVNRGRGEPPSARVGTFRDVPSEAQHSYALFPDIIDS